MSILGIAVNIHSSTALHALGQLLGTVVLVQEVVGDLLQIRQVAVQQRRSNGEEVRVARVVNLHNTPWVLASTDCAAANLNALLRTDNSEWHQTSKLSILLNGVLVILLDIVRKVIHGDTVVLNVLHDELLGLRKLGGRQGVGAANDGDDVDTGSEALHELNIQLAETAETMSVALVRQHRKRHVPVAGGCDEVKHGVDAVVSEARVTLDTRLLCQNVIVLPLEEAHDLGETDGRTVSTKKAVARYVLGSHLASLSTWSPKPGVSTMVREIRVPSSSSSSSVQFIRYQVYPGIRSRSRFVPTV